MTAPPMGKARLAKLLKQLEAHALGEGKLSATQIRAIELLIRKEGAPNTKEGESRAVIFEFEYRIVCPVCHKVQTELPAE